MTPKTIPTDQLYSIEKRVALAKEIIQLRIKCKTGAGDHDENRLANEYKLLANKYKVTVYLVSQIGTADRYKYLRQEALTGKQLEGNYAAIMIAEGATHVFILTKASKWSLKLQNRNVRLIECAHEVGSSTQDTCPMNSRCSRYCNINKKATCACYGFSWRIENVLTLVFVREGFPVAPLGFEKLGTRKPTVDINDGFHVYPSIVDEGCVFKKKLLQEP